MSKIGITIRNKQHSYDLSYSGFYRLRRDIAYLINKEFGILYEEWTSLVSPISDTEGNDRLSKMFENGVLTENDAPVIEFLFMPDTEGKIPVPMCRRIRNLIKDLRLYGKYGYIGQGDCFCFAHFQKLVDESVKNRWVIRWW